MTLRLNDMQRRILRNHGRDGRSGVTKMLLRTARRKPELANESGYTFLAAALEMLDAGYFAEPTAWELSKPALFGVDRSPAELTEFGRQEFERLEQESGE